MKAHLPKLTHAAALGLGLLIAVLIGRQSASSASTDGGAGSQASTRKASSGPDSSSDGTKDTSGRNMPRKQPRLRASEYRKAWDAIADQDLPPDQRAMLQYRLLQQWSEVDMDGALTAAFNTSWDSDRGIGGIQFLLGAFQGEFAKRPTESWDLITSGKFGVGAALAKGQWAQAVIAENPLLVANSIRQLPLSTRKELFPQMLEAIKKDPSMIGPFYDKIASLPQDKSYLEFVRKAIETLGARGTTEDIRGKFLSSTSDAERSILVHEFGKSLSGASLETMQQEVAKLPEADQGRMLRSLTIHRDPGEQTPQFVELLLRTGNYQEVYIQADQHIKKYASDPAKQASLAQWAVNLPAGPGSTNVVHRSVEYYFAADPQGSRAWLETLPADNWARDVALAEYSQQMLYKHNDPESSAWALAKINNPKVQKDATSWRGAWERKQGR